MGRAPGIPWTGAAALMLLACLGAACADEQHGLEARETECREGYPAASAALYECLHPEKAGTLDKATEAWEGLREGEGQ
jgi:hypothetical protein